MILRGLIKVPIAQRIRCNVEACIRTARAMVYMIYLLIAAQTLVYLVMRMKYTSSIIQISYDAL